MDPSKGTVYPRSVNDFSMSVLGTFHHWRTAICTTSYSFNLQFAVIPSVEHVSLHVDLLIVEQISLDLEQVRVARLQNRRIMCGPSALSRWSYCLHEVHPSSPDRCVRTNDPKAEFWGPTRAIDDGINLSGSRLR